MNSALDNLYDELLYQADENEHKEELTDAEKAKRFVEEKRIAIDKLKEISLKQLERESKGKEETRTRELERKRQDGIAKRTDKKKQERETTSQRFLAFRRLEERIVRFWRRDVTQKRRETGVSYCGESKRAGNAWVPHGHGEYRVNAEVVYKGAFCDGAMHGDGRLLLDNGEIWVGQLWKDMMHGIGTLISKDDTQHRRAIYWRGRRVCFLNELKPGCRLQMLGDEYVRVANGEGMVVSAKGAEGRYLVRLDSGVQKLLRLDCEHFRVLRHKPPVIPLDPIVGATAGKVLYDYEEDQAKPKTTAYRENLFWPDLWAGRARAKEEQAEVDLEAKRSKILTGRHAKRDEKEAVHDAWDAGRVPEQETPRKEGITRENATTPPEEQRGLEVGVLSR